MDEKVKVAHVQLSSCCGCLISLSDTYEKLLDILGAIDLVYCQTLADARDIPECDVILVEGSVCLDDHHAVETLEKIKENGKIIVALGACASTGGVTRFCKGNQLSKPVHGAFSPITEVIKCDYAIPGCPPAPELIENFLIALLSGDIDYLKMFSDYVKNTDSCGCELLEDVVNKALCMGCGSCAASCPTRAITMVDGRPVVNSPTCIKCGCCGFQCPRIRMCEKVKEIE